MTCPQCGHEQPDVFSQCQKCRYIFPTVSAHRARTAAPTPIGAIPAAEGPSIPALLGAIAAVVVLIAALWWLYSPEGLPVPDGAYINENHRFAIRVPDDWLVLTADNYREMFKQLGDRFPKSMQEGLSERRIEVGFLKELKEAEFSPSINIVVMNTEIPDLDESQLNEAAQALTSQFGRMMDKYRLERKELVTVDDLTGAQFTSNATTKFKVPQSQPINAEGTPAWQAPNADTRDTWKSFDLKMVQTLVPGKNRAYIITATALESQFPEFQRAFANAVESFRVLQRPSRFGPIVMGGIQGGLIGGMGYLLYYIVTAVIALVKRSQTKAM